MLKSRYEITISRAIRRKKNHELSEFVNKMWENWIDREIYKKVELTSVTITKDHFSRIEC